MVKSYYVYILSSNYYTLYIGITSSLQRRIQEHKEKPINSFTSKYNVNKLVYIEAYDNPAEAIQREKQIKKWNRKKKIELIKNINPNFDDISNTISI